MLANLTLHNTSLVMAFQRASPLLKPMAVSRHYFSSAEGFNITNEKTQHSGKPDMKKLIRNLDTFDVFSQKTNIKEFKPRINEAVVFSKIGGCKRGNITRAKTECVFSLGYCAWSR